MTIFDEALFVGKHFCKKIKRQTNKITKQNKTEEKDF